MKKQILFAVTVGLTTKNGRELSPVEIENAQKLAGEILGFASITEITGYYKGGKERSLKIEHIGGPEMEYKIRLLANQLKEYMFQESVMIMKQDIEVEFIS